ncbi:unnamed protein product [Lupinus luteus]|uniref:Uncharacterized protein n=1 Tax=Lupinus luteus TaxID=3873 RepID=A0AAV1VX94_LUPLU
MAARNCGLPLMKYLRVNVDSLPNNNNRLPFTISPINVSLRRFSGEKQVQIAYDSIHFHYFFCLLQYNIKPNEDQNPFQA